MAKDGKSKESAHEATSEEEVASQLQPGEVSEARKRRPVRAHVIHAAILAEGEEELDRPVASLAWSGLAAGLSLGFSLVAEGILRFQLPDATWTPLVSKLGYSIGFLIVVLGRQQLFTEKTLTAILPLLHAKDLSTLAGVAKLWAVVFAANIAGAALFSLVLAETQLFPPPVHAEFETLARESIAPPPSVTFLRAIFAGWLIALMVWLQPYAETARIWVIIIVTWLIGIGHFSHIIAGSVIVFYGVWNGDISLLDYTLRFMLPALAGNIVGGVALVAALGHAQVTPGESEK